MTRSRLALAGIALVVAAAAAALLATRAARFEGRAAGEWAPLLVSDDWAEVTTALDDLEQGGEDAGPVLRDLLANGNADVRWFASSVLARSGAAARSSVDDLEKALSDADLGVRALAAGTLVRLGKHVGEAVPVLAEALGAREWSVRCLAMRDLQSLDHGLEPALPGLIAALGEPDPRIRRPAAELIARLGPRAKDAIPALLGRLAGDVDETVRVKAFVALIRAGADDAALRDALGKAGDPDPDSSIRAMREAFGEVE